MVNLLAEVLPTLRVSGLLWTATLVVDRLLPLGVSRLWRDRRVASERLREQLELILIAWGMPEPAVKTVVGHILYADLCGIDSHGAAMMLHYERLLRSGALRVAAETTVVREDQSTALLDGGGGLGHQPADAAMRLAIAKARQHGLAAVAVRNSGHFGAAGTYTAMATQAGMIGFATTNTREPAVIPTFANQAMFGTNPIAFAAPAGRNPPFALDMATSAAAVGKLAVAWRRNRELPEGLALDRRGEPERNPRRAFRARRLTPLGSTPDTSSHKGYGLAAMVEILSALLPGVQGKPWFDGAGIGHFFLVIDIERFRPRDEFTADLDVVIDALHHARPLDDSRPVLVPGDPERAAAACREIDGIPIARAVLEDLRGIAHRCGVDFVLDR